MTVELQLLALIILALMFYPAQTGHDRLQSPGDELDGGHEKSTNVS